MKLLLLLVTLAAVGAGALLALFSWFIDRRVKAALPPQGRFVNCGDVRFHVREQGSGPAVLLIHGLSGQMRHFTYGVADRLATQFRVVTIDRPGSGHSTRAASTPADIATQAASIARLIETLQIGPVTVVGHSLGGAVALALALGHRPLVSGLALIAPLTHFPEDGKPPAAFRALTIETPWLRTLFAWTLAVPGTISNSRAVLDQVFGPEAVPRDYAIRGGGLISLCPHQFIAASRDMQAVPAILPGMVARYATLDLPVRVLYGRHDRILDWQANGQALVDKLPQATLEVVEGGHMLPLTMPERTAECIAAAAREAAAARAG